MKWLIPHQRGPPLLCLISISDATEQLWGNGSISVKLIPWWSSEQQSMLHVGPYFDPTVDSNPQFSILKTYTHSSPLIWWTIYPKYLQHKVYWNQHQHKHVLGLSHDVSWFVLTGNLPWNTIESKIFNISRLARVFTANDGWLIWVDVVKQRLDNDKTWKVKQKNNLQGLISNQKCF